jgi:hypothetical protein
MKIVFTIISYNYLAFARTLSDSLKKSNPDVKFIVALVDALPKDLNEDFEIIPTSELDVGDEDEFYFKYNVTCLNTAVKPLYFQLLFEKYNPESIVFLDPDIFVYQSLDPLFESLKKNDVLLTPHTLSPYPSDGCIPDEIRIMQVGTYNLGFVGLRNSPKVREFCDWWWTKLENLAINDIQNGLFTDQKWMDLIPSFFDDVDIIRDPGYNVAYWNLHERKDFSKSEDGYRINGSLIKFFHFSGMNHSDLNAISKFQNRYTLDQFNKILLEIFTNYRKNVKLNATYPDIPYAFGYFNNGVKIPDIVRDIYHRSSNRAAFGNPFETGDNGSFYKWLKSPNVGKMTNFMRAYYDIALHLRKAYPNPNRHQKHITRWCLNHFESDLGVPKELLV